MSSNRNLIVGLATSLIVSLLIIAGCSPGQVSADAPPPDLAVLSPDQARDAALAYLRQEDPAVPSAEVSWQGKDISSEEAITIQTFLYEYQNWNVAVVSPQVVPERKVFTVVVLNEADGFQWAGLVDAYGKVAHMDRLPGTPMPTTATVIPTVISFPTGTPNLSTSTPFPVPCNDASFLEDVTIPDGTTFPPGKRFLKVWRLRNGGSCTWTTDYDLVFVGGNRLDAQLAIPLAETVMPGESVELGAPMVAPQAPGTYRGFWMLRNARGERFGVGDDAGDSFWVEIKVVGDSDQYKYNFALEYCSAIWRTALNRISCGDEASLGDGSVQFLISPELENRHENEATLWLHPNAAPDGWIEGTYPPITVRSGDHFRAWVGCLGGYERCDVTFYLAYIGEDNRTTTLGTWHEVYDGQVSVIDIDLSNLDGQSVQFILGMEPSSTNVASAQGFWFVPRIQRP